MKKNLSKILSLLLIAVMIFTFAACGSNDNSGDAEGPVSLSIATGGTSGTYYGYCGIIAQVFNQELGDTMNLSAVSTGASMANIQQMQVGASQIAIVQNDVMDYAYNATDLFEGQDPYTDFSTIMVCYPETIQIIAQKNITSIDQLKGKRVSTGDAGSGVEFNARQILAAYGLDIDADIVKNSQSFADSADALKNGQIDAAFVVAGAPTTAVTELAASGYKFNLLEIDAEHAEQLKSQYGFYTDITVPAGTYTPVCLSVLGGALGWTLFGVIWGLAVLGVFVTLFWVNAPRTLTTMFYVGMGWIAVLAFQPLLAALPAAAVAWMLAGGVAYTVGGLLYALKWPLRNHPRFGCHEIFHLFVLLGSVCFFAMLWTIFVG